MLVRDPIDYQATDLSRKAREVIDAARHGGAYIRDKDGLRLVLAPAADVERSRDILALAIDLIRTYDALSQEQASGPAAFGGLAWLSLLPEEARPTCIAEISGALLVSASGTSMKPLERVLADWRATAEAWANPETREVLLADEPAPLVDAEL